MVIFDSQNNWYKSPVGATTKDLRLRIRFENVDEITGVNVIFLNLKNNETEKVEMSRFYDETGPDFYYLDMDFDEKSTFEYYFEVFSNDEKFYVRRKYGSFEGYITKELDDLPWVVVVYKKIESNELMKKGIMYQIFPDRFNKGKTESVLPDDRIYREWGEMPYYEEEKIGRDFFGGNFNGIKEKIPYLKKLYVDVIYSNPVCLSDTNHRYAAADYMKVDSVLGTEKEFVQLMDAFHKANMIFVLDGVFNHVSSNSIYFNKNNSFDVDGAWNSENSFYKDWFYFKKNDEIGYECWWGDKTLPKLNYSSPTLRDYVLGKDGVLRYWYEKWKIDGVRQDVADELPNDVRDIMFDISDEERKDKKVIIPEVWEDASRKIAYDSFMEYMQGNQATSVMNYPVRDMLVAYVRYGGDYWVSRLKATCEEIFKENYPREVAYSVMNFISTHDTVRGITKLAGLEVDENNRDWQAENNFMSDDAYEIGRRRLMLAYLFIFFLPGIPSIYYGDEIGMQGMKDPFCRTCFTWDKIDEGLLEFFKRLCKVRHDNRDFLGDAEFNVVSSDSELFVFERSLGDRRLCVCINRSDSDRDISDILKGNDDGFEKANVIFEISHKESIRFIYNGSRRVVLKANEGMAFEKKRV